MNEWLSIIFEIVLIPLLGVLTTYLVQFIKIKTKTLQEKARHEKYITMISDTITSCVIATNQTYVEELKKQDSFNADAQQEAFTMTKDAVLEILTDDAKEYITEICGDLNTYLIKQIEATVNLSK